MSTIALIAFGVLVFLMLMRPGVDTEDLGGYLGTGSLYEIFPTIMFGFVITCIHYGLFNHPDIINLFSDDPKFIFYAELFLNGVFSLLSMVIASFSLGKSMGVGFISTVSLGCYTYYLACL